MEQARIRESLERDSDALARNPTKARSTAAPLTARLKDRRAGGERRCPARDRGLGRGAFAGCMHDAHAADDLDRGGDRGREVKPIG